MKPISMERLLAVLALGATLVCASPIAVMAKEELLILLVYKPSAKRPVATATADAEGRFSVKGLKPGTYKICLENGTGCVNSDVGEDGSIRGIAKADNKELAGKKHNYVGHVTLLR